MIKLIKIEEWMSKPVRAVKKSTPLREVVNMMANNNIGAVPVVENDHPVGIVTERDIIRRVVVKNLNVDNHVASDIMTTNPKTIPSDSTILDVARLMSENNFRRLLVMKKGKLIGIVTAKDVIEVMSA